MTCQGWPFVRQVVDSAGKREALTNVTDADVWVAGCTLAASRLKIDFLICYKTRAGSLPLSASPSSQLCTAQFREGPWGDHSDFKGKSSLPSCGLALPYITPSVPGCELRRLVSILNHKPEGRTPVWLSVYVWALLSVCLCLHLSPPTIFVAVRNKRRHPSMRCKQCFVNVFVRTWRRMPEWMTNNVR